MSANKSNSLRSILLAFSVSILNLPCHKTTSDRSPTDVRQTSIGRWFMAGWIYDGVSLTLSYFCVRACVCAYGRVPVKARSRFCLCLYPRLCVSASVRACMRACVRACTRILHVRACTRILYVCACLLLMRVRVRVRVAQAQ